MILPPGEKGEPSVQNTSNNQGSSSQKASDSGNVNRGEDQHDEPPPAYDDSNYLSIPPSSFSGPSQPSSPSPNPQLYNPSVIDRELPPVPPVLSPTLSTISSSSATSSRGGCSKQKQKQCSKSPQPNASPFGNYDSQHYMQASPLNMPGSSTSREPFSPPTPNLSMPQAMPSFAMPQASPVSIPQNTLSPMGHTPTRTPSAMHSPSTSTLAQLNPSPPCFDRPPPPNLPYGPFEPTALFGLGNQIMKGFPPIAPAAHLPHPFETHDVPIEDWRRFLSDITAAGSNPGAVEKTLASIAPVARGVGLLSTIAGIAPLVAMGIDQHIKSFKAGPVAQVVDHWNHYFFRPRGIQVALAQGKVLYTGSDKVPADMDKEHQGRPIGYRGGSHSDEDSSSSSSDDGRSERSERRRERRERRREKKDAKRERRTNRRSKHSNFMSSADEKWRVVVSYKPAVL